MEIATLQRTKPTGPAAPDNAEVRQPQLAQLILPPTITEQISDSEQCRLLLESAAAAHRPVKRRASSPLGPPPPLPNYHRLTETRIAAEAKAGSTSARCRRHPTTEDAATESTGLEGSPDPLLHAWATRDLEHNAGQPCDESDDVAVAAETESWEYDQTDSILCLNQDVLFHVLQLLPVVDLVHLFKSSRRFAAFRHLESLWHHLCKRDFGLLTKGRCKSYHDLYKLFYKVHHLVLSDAGDHLYKETDMLWFMASIRMDCPVARWKTIPASKIKQFGLERKTMLEHCSGEMVATGQIGQGGRLVHHYTWQVVVKTLLAVFDGAAKTQEYLIRRCLDQRITSSVNNRHRHLQMEQRQRLLLKRLSNKPSILTALLAGMFRSGLACSPDDAPLREETIFFIHPLLRLYRQGRLLDGLKAVRSYTKLCCFLQAELQGKGTGEAHLCQRIGMEVHDYSACLWYVQSQLQERLEDSTVTFEDMAKVAVEYFRRLEKVWDWQLEKGQHYHWQYRHSCVVTAHSAFGSYLETGNVKSLELMKRYFEAREALSQRLDELVNAMDGCLPRPEIETVYLAMGIMPPPATQPSCLWGPEQIKPPPVAPPTCLVMPRGMPVLSLRNSSPAFRLPSTYLPLSSGGDNNRHWRPGPHCRYPPWAEPWQDLATFAPLQPDFLLQPDSLLQLVLKPAGYWKLRSLPMFDQVMFQRSATGWEYREQLRVWLHGNPPSEHHCLYNLVQDFLNSGSQEDANKVLSCVIQRYRHYANHIATRQANTMLTLNKLLLEQIRRLDKKELVQHQDEEEAETNGRTEGQLTASLDDESSATGGDVSGSSTPISTGKPCPAETDSIDVVASLDKDTADNDEMATSDAPSSSTSKSTLQGLRQSDGRIGLIANSMVATGYSLVDRNLHEYFYLLKD